MITLDTNLVLRILLDDDRKQRETALAAIRRAGRAILQTTIVLELIWVLQGKIGVSRKAAAETLAGFGEAEHIVAPIWLPRLPEAVEAGLELDDAIHLLTADPDIPFATFDQALRRRAPHFTAQPEVMAP